MNENINKLSEKNKKKAVWRFAFIGANNLNYGTLMGTGYAWAVAEALREIYPNDEDYMKAMRLEHEYFNITPYMGPLVIGADMAMQEKEGIDSLEVVRSIKTSLMGPLSGIGDSLLWILYPTIMGSIAGYMALDGNPLGAIIWILLNLTLIILRFKLFSIGYNSGVRLITDLSNQLTSITEGASVMGLTVIGSLIATVVRIKTPLTFKFGGVNLDLQNGIFDKILPALLPVILTIVVYWLMEKRKWGFLKIILFLIIFSLVSSYFGILGI